MDGGSAITYYIIIGLAYFAVGLGVTIVFYYLLRLPFLGGFWGALAVGLVGSFFGGVLDFVVVDIDVAPAIAGIVDILPAAVASVVLVWIYSGLSHREREQS